jgi:predicted nucleic acid-binding protein
MKRKVYIETSIPSFYHTTRTDPKIVGLREVTRRWWATERQWFDLSTSLPVFTELQGGNYPSREQAVQLLVGIPLLEVTPIIDDIVIVYAEHKLMPSNNLADAYHLALASYYGVDYLLTWNCLHLANVRKQEHIAKINERLRLRTPTLTTPENLFRESAEE